MQTAGIHNDYANVGEGGGGGGGDLKGWDMHFIEEKNYPNLIPWIE